MAGTPLATLIDEVMGRAVARDIDIFPDVQLYFEPGGEPMNVKILGDGKVDLKGFIDALGNRQLKREARSRFASLARKEGKKAGDNIVPMSGTLDLAPLGEVTVFLLLYCDDLADNFMRGVGGALFRAFTKWADSVWEWSADGRKQARSGAECPNLTFHYPRPAYIK